MGAASHASGRTILSLTSVFGLTYLRSNDTVGARVVAGGVVFAVLVCMKLYRRRRPDGPGMVNDDA